MNPQRALVGATPGIGPCQKYISPEEPSTRQPQLALLGWVCQRHPREWWWRRPAHRQMIRAMFGRISGEEARDA